jgi:hypothetical protein
MKLLWMRMINTFFLAAALTGSAWAAGNAVPGTVNYVEGQVAIGDKTLNAHSVGMNLEPGEAITTGTGKVEILLAPGVFLRVGDQSSVELVSGGLTDTSVTVQRGRAMVEVTEIHPENDLRVTEDGVVTQLQKKGLYDFDAAQNQVRVFGGKAALIDQDREVKVDGGHQVDFSVPGVLKTAKFDKQAYEESDLYRWSSLRSSYLAEANVEAARVYVANGLYGPGWIGAGWYWSPWFATYTFIPGDGIFYSPFGWGFYSPLFVFRAPVFVGRPFVHQFGPGFRPPAAFAGPGVAPGFHSGPRTTGRQMAARGSGFSGGGAAHSRGRR